MFLSTPSTCQKKAAAKGQSTSFPILQGQGTPKTPCTVQGHCGVKESTGNTVDAPPLPELLVWLAVQDWILKV